MEPITILIIVLIAVAFSIGIIAYIFSKGLKLQQERMAIEAEKTNKKLDELKEMLAKLDKNFSRHTTEFTGKFTAALDSMDTRFGSEFHDLKRAVERSNSDITSKFSKESRIISREVTNNTNKNTSKLSKSLKESTIRILKKLPEKKRVVKKKPKIKPRIKSKVKAKTSKKR